MMAPEERYNSDPEYRMLVDTIESLIHKAQFTPSEIRQAALLACIRYESIYPRTPYFLEGEYEIDKIKAEIKIIKNHLKEIKIIKKHLNLHG